MTSVVDAKKKIEHTSIKDGVDEFGQASCLSVILYTWATRLVMLMSRREIEFRELWKLRSEEKADMNLEGMRKEWNKETLKPLPLRSFKSALIRLVQYEFLKTLFFNLIWACFAVTSASFFIINIIGSLRGDVTPLYEGLLYAAGFGICEICASCFRNYQWMHGSLLGMHMRSAAQTLLYEKVTRLRFTGTSAGEAINILSSDTQRFCEAGQYAVFLIATPIILTAIMIIMYFLMGTAAIIGFFVLILLVPIQTYFGRLASKYRQNSAKISDKRIKLMNEILTGAKLIKLYAWESRFASAIAKVRDDEMKVLRTAAVLQALNNVLNFSAPSLVALFTFMAHILLSGQQLIPGPAFAVLALFNAARFPLSVMPIAVKLAAESLIGCDRITKFLNLPEIQAENLPELEISTGELTGGVSLPLVEMINGSYSWNSDDSKGKEIPIKSEEAPNPMMVKAIVDTIVDETQPLVVTPIPKRAGALNNITFSVNKGECLCVIGKVGAGKSSLLYSLFGGLIKMNGRAILRGKKQALVEQQPWTFNATLKENIIFQSDFNQELYDSVIERCALIHDIENLPSRDDTEIGEKGINLSGGQKARVSLARALYSKANIYFLDDPLSAVDSHVGKHLFHKALRGPHMQDAAVVLVTHQTQYLPYVDKILILNEGHTEFYGTYDELKNVDAFHKLGLMNGEKSDDAVDIEEVEKSVKVVTALENTLVKVEATANTKETGKLVQKEERQLGGISIPALKSWIRDIGGFLMLALVLLLLVGSNLSNIGSSWWVSKWVNNAFQETQIFYLVGYAIATGIVALLSFISNIIYTYANLRGATRLHDRCFATIMKGTASFFDATPIGRILNRFSGDLDQVDVRLLDTSQSCFSYLTQAFLSVIAIGIIFPYFLLCLIPIVAVYVYNTNLFRKGIRQVKRMDNISRSPLFGHVSATMSGLASARVYGVLEKFKDTNLRLVDQTSITYFAFFQLNRWFGVRIDWITATISCITSFFCILLRDTLPPGTAGLALIYALGAAGILQYSTRLLSETEAIFTSVERLNYLDTTTPQEGVGIVSNMEEKVKSWPSDGRLSFQNLSVRYNESLPPVLQGINIEIPGRSHVGICGRTGSGKSTLTYALWRMLEPLNGTIFIDGVDISSIGLYQLRSKLSIIPQVPTLFVGTVRSNLDPFSEYTDEQIWTVLEQVQLKMFIGSLETGLNSPVTENGDNFSVGQKQLFCFCRALLRDSKIIVMDEATSNIDFETDTIIQATIAKAFSDKTLLIVAHRLSTIMTCDLILVLDKGQVSEFGSPSDLLKNDGPFSHLVSETGEEFAAHLRSLAFESSKKKLLVADEAALTRLI